MSDIVIHALKDFQLIVLRMNDIVIHTLEDFQLIVKYLIQEYECVSYNLVDYFKMNVENKFV